MEPVRTDLMEQPLPVVVFMNSYLSADPALLVEIIDSLVFLEGAFR